MKLKELLEGHYFIYGITDALYIEGLEASETQPRYITELEAIKVVHASRRYRKNN
jgi:hypothetical protein